MKAKKTNPRSTRYLHERYVGSDPDRLASLEEERTNAKIARTLYDLRTQAGLTQRELAKMVGTSASVICQLEDSDYQGHSLSMLQRIAAVLDRRVEVTLVPLGTSAEAKKRQVARVPHPLAVGSDCRGDRAS